MRQHIGLPREVTPGQVHEVLGRHVLADGFRLVYDTRASRGSWVVDARSGEKYLDLYTFFASAPLGSNPRGLADDPDFMAVLAEVAANKPANPDMYTTHYAQFVETFARVLGDPALPHLFFVEGGALAVENALKTAFDWKSRRNEAAGRPAGLGAKVLHLTRAFHGRSGYTLSLTNTEPGKTDRFPKFDWPRIPAPAVNRYHDVAAAEQQALEHTLGNLEIFEVDPLVRPVRPLLDIPRSEQNAWYPGRMDEEARVTGCAPRRDPAR